MAQQLINVGAAPNDGLGDPLRTGGQKINLNFDELYALLSVITVQPQGLSLQAPTPADPMRIDWQTSLNQFPVRQETAFNDFGTGQVDNLFSPWDSNPDNVPTHPRYAESIENYYDTGFQNLLEHFRTYQSADGTVDYRTWLFNVDIATHEAAEEHIVGTWDLKNRLGNTGDIMARLLRAVTARNGLDIFGAVGIGGTARNSAVDGAVLIVRGDTGNGLECVTIQPNAMPNYAAALFVDVAQALGQADARPCNFQGWGSTSCNWEFFQTHATALGRMHVRSLGGDSIVRCGTSTKNFSMGIDESAGTAELANHFDMASNPLVTWNLTTNASAFAAPIGLKSYTVGTLPSSASATQMIYVSDESGGAVPAFSDGANWRRVTDRAIVS